METKRLKIGIISGIISSVLVIIFINPILSFVWKVTVAVAGSIHQGYVDRIYRNAGFVDNNEIGRMTFLAVLSFGLVLLHYQYTQWVLRDSSHPFPMMKRIIKVVSSATWLSIGVLVLVMMVRFSILQGTMVITESFNQRLTILAPAIKDDEYKTLKARWAGLETKADYDAIVNAMDKRAKELSVSLPPVKEP
jgi:hypothetical protein